MTMTTPKLTYALLIDFAVCAVLGAVLHVGSVASILLRALAIAAAVAVLIVLRRSVDARAELGSPPPVRSPFSADR